MEQKLLNCKTYSEYKLLCEVYNLEYFNCDSIVDLISDSSFIDSERLIHDLAEETLRRNRKSN